MKGKDERFLKRKKFKEVIYDVLSLALVGEC